MLVVHRSADGSTLAHALAQVLATPPADPLAPEIVAVPAKGVERWLAQRLSHVLGATAGDGVCANVLFPPPSSLLDQAVRTASVEHAAAVERWAPPRAMWPLLSVIDNCVRDEQWCRPLARHIGPPDADRGRRLAVSRRLAARYDEYGQSRPEMLRAWAAGADDRGDGTALEGDLRWQAEVWRRLRTELGKHPAELLDEACQVLRDEPDRIGLPERISVFGASRLSPARLRVLVALAEHRDVHLWLNHASPELWRTVMGTASGVRRREDQVRSRLANPLLGSLARDVLELQQMVARLAPQASEVLHEGPPLPDTILGRLKTGLRCDRVPERPPPLDPADRSVRVHACHGRTRQVEVLREVLLGLLADDPTLEPRDVIVMCPDVESFAPIVAATFSLGSQDQAGRHPGPQDQAGRHPGPQDQAGRHQGALGPLGPVAGEPPAHPPAHPAARLRVRLADRALRQTNGLMAVLARLLELGTSRTAASEVLDLAGVPAVRQRFRFADADIERLRDWTLASGVRWGLDQDHRRTWSLDRVEQGTWRAGLDRLLVGVTMEGSRVAWRDVVPLDDVDSSDIDLAGRMAEMIDRLAAAQELMSGRHTPADWMRGLGDAVMCLAATTYETGWQELQLRSELGDIAAAAAAAAAGNEVLLGLADVRALLDDVLAGRPTRAGFRTGDLTVCTLVPMRSVPHRVVCLLGLDDGVFPRQSIRDGDDVLARDPWVGERDPQSEDRQLLLDAICAAGDHLVITYTGADERTGVAVPPAVPLGELLDALDSTATVADGGRVRDVVTTRHPLQPFDPRNFIDGELNVAGPFSFDPLGHAGAMAAAGRGAEPAPFLAGPLADLPPVDVPLADLRSLLAHPARGFLRQRLRVAESVPEEEPADALPVALDNLQLWQVGERVLADRLAGLEPPACIALERGRGSLPPGRLGMTRLREIGNTVDSLLLATTSERAYEPESYDVDVALADGTRLTGTVRGVRGSVLFSVTYSRLAARHRLGAWLDLIALKVARPERTWTAVAVGRGQGGAARSELKAPTAAGAAALLEQLVGLYRAGLRSPLPLPVKTAARYAYLREQGKDVEAARKDAVKEWLDSRSNVGEVIPREQSDREHLLIYGPAAPLSVLTAQRPQPGEGGSGWPDGETDRFGLLARRLWEPLLSAESGVRS